MENVLLIICFIIVYGLLALNDYLSKK